MKEIVFFEHESKMCFDSENYMYLDKSKTEKFEPKLYERDTSKFVPITKNLIKQFSESYKNGNVKEEKFRVGIEGIFKYIKVNDKIFSIKIIKENLFVFVKEFDLEIDEKLFEETSRITLFNEISKIIYETDFSSKIKE